MINNEYTFTSRMNQPGHSWYYSMRFLPPAQRHILMALVDWCAAVRLQIKDCHEPSVAHVQLGWWSSEVDRLCAQQAQHPASQQLLMTSKGQTLPWALLKEYLLSLSMDIDMHRYQTRRELDLYCERRGGSLSVLYTHVMGYTDPHTLVAAKKLGQHLQYLYLGYHLARDIGENYLYLPLDELDTHNISAATLLRRECPAEFAAWFYQQMQEQQAAIATLLQSLPREDRFAQRGQIILQTLYGHTLLQMQAEGMNPLKEKMQLTPLRKLWLAWRCYKKEKALFHK